MELKLEPVLINDYMFEKLKKGDIINITKLQDKQIVVIPLKYHKLPIVSTNSKD